MGFMGQRRNDRNRMRYAKNSGNFTIDTSGLEGMLGQLRGQDLEAQAIRDTQAAGYGYDEGQYTANAVVGGQGANAFRGGRQEAQNQGRLQFGSAALGRFGQLQSNNIAQQIGANQAISSFRGQERSLQTSLMGDSYNSIGQRYGGLADMGTGLLGMYASNKMGLGRYVAGSGQTGVEVT